MAARLLLVLAALASLSGSVVSTEENSWTLANDQVEATFKLTSAGLVLDSVDNPQTGSRLNAVPGPDSTVTINGAQAALGASAAGWVLEDASMAQEDTTSRLTFTFRSQRAPVVAVRSYACYRGSPAIEAWTTFRAFGSSVVTLSNLNVWQLTVPSGVVNYELGLRGDAAGQANDDAFSLRSASLESGQQLNLSEQNRSTEQFLPMIGADLESHEFFGGLMWSGSWQILVQALAARQARVTVGVPGPTLTVDDAHPLETPHGFFGFTPGGRAEISAALRPFLMQGVRQGRPFRPLVTDNTWFSYGTEIDQDSMMSELAGAASVGVELFVVDAGWYTGPGSGSDFSSGLGSWQVDATRFPDGLGALREYAHSLGMQFGVWVEPERVALSTVGRPQLAQHAWLASNNGQFGSPTSAQICFANPAARQWALDRLVAFLDEVQPDYLKWDNNLWVNCTRSGHGHGTTDGNFMHVKGLYEVLQALRERYPDMQIENCSQGGNRADFGMLRYTDTAWMDDRTSPTAHVRHNLEGLMTFFPPAYLLSFVLNDSEPIVDSPDLGLLLRSRMPGILGLTYRSSALTESDRARLAAEIGVFKSLRGITRDASGALLTEQAAPEGGPAWDAVQETTTDSAEAIVFAFQNDGAVPRTVVRPRGLEPETVYALSSVEGESLGTGTGAALMADGIAITESFESAARILLLHPIVRASAPPSINRAKRHE
jgi:alpha-galactosidase